jgi:hypothetical protein
VRIDIQIQYTKLLRLKHPVDTFGGYNLALAKYLDTIRYYSGIAV